MVKEIWRHSPTWAAHSNILECYTAMDLIKLATDKEEQLVVSSDILDNAPRKQCGGQWHLQMSESFERMTNLYPGESDVGLRS